MQTQNVLRILVADPDSTLASSLEEKGYEVTSVRSGTSVLERAAERQYDFFLIHYNLSDLNGGIVVDNMMQYPWKKRPPIYLYSRDENPALKKHSVGRFPADLYIEGKDKVSKIPYLLQQQLSGIEIKSSFVDSSIVIPSEKLVHKDSIKSEEENLLPNAEELTVLSRELEIAHRELNELSSYLTEFKNVKAERDGLKLEIQKLTLNVDAEKTKNKVLAEENRELRNKYEELRKKAKEDILKLKERETRFNKQILDIKRDAEKLMQTKDQKILLLKREFEDLKFELERRGEKLQLSKERIEYWKHRVSKVTKALKVAMNALENEEGGHII